MRTLKEGKVLFTKINLIPVHFGFFKISILSEKKTRAIFPYIDYLEIRHQPVQAVLRAGCAPCSLCTLKSVLLIECSRVSISLENTTSTIEFLYIQWRKYPMSIQFVPIQLDF